MLLPTTSTAALLTLLAATFLLGLWANTQKAAGKHRFELYYYDFAIGAAVSSLIMAYTIGTLGPEVTFEDNLLIAGKHQMAIAFAAGLVFNLGNMLLVAGVSVAGVAAAFPVALGTMYIAHNVIQAVSGAEVTSGQWGGLAFVAVGVVAAFAATVQRAGVKTGGYPTGIRGVILSAACGVILALVSPIADSSRAGDIGISAIGLLVFMSLGILFSTILYNLYFLNLPVSGKPLSMKQYAKATLPQHAWGWIGGLLWAGGFAALQFSGAVAKPLLPSAGLRDTLPAAAALVTALCGLLIWKEFSAAAAKTRLMLWAALGCYAAGLVLAAA